MAVSERAKAGIAAGGGRTYKGSGLGPLQAWKCVACGQENAGPLKEGCISCGAGKPGTQVRKPADAVDTTPSRVAQRAIDTTDAARALRTPLRIKAPAVVDYDEIERRVARVLEQRLGGGYSADERATLYLALGVYIEAWEQGLIEPEYGLTIEKTRELASRVLPDDMPEIPAEEAEAEHGTTETATPPNSNSAPQYDADDGGDDGGDDDIAYSPDDDAGAPDDGPIPDIRVRRPGGQQPE